MTELLIKIESWDWVGKGEMRAGKGRGFGEFVDEEWALEEGSQEGIRDGFGVGRHREEGPLIFVNCLQSILIRFL